MCLLQTLLLGDPTLARAHTQIAVAATCVFIAIGFFIFGEVLVQAVLKDIEGDFQKGPVINGSPCY